MSIFLAGLTSALDRRNQLRGRLHEFDAVAERIRHVDAVEPLERLVVVDGEAGSDGSGRQTVHVVDNERWVRLGRWLEAGIDTEVYLQVSVFEPAATANGEVTGFRNMRDAEHSFVERDSLGLESGRHRQLHMIESNDAHATHSAPRLRPCRQANIGCSAWAVMRRGCGVVVRIIVRSFCADLRVGGYALSPASEFLGWLRVAAVMASPSQSAGGVQMAPIDGSVVLLIRLTTPPQTTSCVPVHTALGAVTPASGPLSCVTHSPDAT